MAEEVVDVSRRGISHLLSLLCFPTFSLFNLSRSHPTDPSLVGAPLSVQSSLTGLHRGRREMGETEYNIRESCFYLMNSSCESRKSKVESQLSFLSGSHGYERG